MRVITFVLLALCIFGATHGGAVKKAAKAAAVTAKNAAIDAKNAALASAQASIDALTESVSTMIRDIEAQIMDAIMAPVQKVNNVITAIDNIKKGFPTCVDNVQAHINDTMDTMWDDLDMCKETAFNQTEALFTDCFTVIHNFPAHTATYVSTFNKCLKHTNTSRCTNIHHIVKATACATHATDDYVHLMKDDVAAANKTLVEAPARVPPIITGATACSTTAVNEAYDSLTDTLNVIKKCAGMTVKPLLLL